MLKRIVCICILLISTLNVCFAKNLFEDRNWVYIGIEESIKRYSRPESIKLTDKYPRKATTLTGSYSPNGIDFPPLNTKFYYAISKDRFYENDITKRTILYITLYDNNGDIITALTGPHDETIPPELRRTIHNNLFGKKDKEDNKK